MDPLNIQTLDRIWKYAVTPNPHQFEAMMFVQKEDQTNKLTQIHKQQLKHVLFGKEESQILQTKVNNLNYSTIGKLAGVYISPLLFSGYIAKT